MSESVWPPGTLEQRASTLAWLFRPAVICSRALVRLPKRRPKKPPRPYDRHRRRKRWLVPGKFRARR